MLNNSPEESNGVFTASVVVLNDYGLHARPAASLARLAQNYTSIIRLCLGKQCADGKSLLDILSLAASKNTELILECRGEDAPEAGKALLKLFKNKFMLEPEEEHPA